MSSHYIIFWWDTEDYATPETDDAIVVLDRIFAGVGAKTVFKLVGEKLRALERRGRADAIGSLSRHHVGYHTDLHSFHPTVAEYVDGLNWREGVKEIEKRERRGYDDIVRAFGRSPVCYGQPGASYAPQFYEVMKGWGIPAYLGGSVWLGLSRRPSYYQKVFNIGGLWDVKPHFNFRLGERALEGAKKKLDGMLAILPEGGLISHGAHPCEIWTTRFWDADNFSRGRQTPLDALRPAPLRPEPERREMLEAFDGYVRHVVDRGLRIIGPEEAKELHPDGADGRALSPEEVRRVAHDFSETVSFVEFDEFSLTPAEGLNALVNFLRGFADSGEAPPRTRFESPLGPEEEEAADDAGGTLKFKELLDSCRSISLADERYMPGAMAVGGRKLRPEDFAGACARAAAALLKGERPDAVELRPMRFVPREMVRKRDWATFPESFRGERIAHYTALQGWSFKPAVFAG